MRFTGSRLVATGVMGLVLLAGCGGGDDKRSSPSSLPTTSVAPAVTTTTAEASVTPSTAPRSAPTTSRSAPRLVNDIPQVTASPARGKAGDRIRIEGSGFTAANWKQTTAPLWLASPEPGCDLFADAEHQVSVDASGFLTGTFVVPGRGECRQSDKPVWPANARSYKIVYQCTACAIGEFEVTADPPFALNCSDIVFDGNGENTAYNVTASGVTCEEADAFIHKVRRTLTAVGPADADLEGFHCVRTGQEEFGMPSSDYACSAGSKKVTFARS